MNEEPLPGFKIEDGRTFHGVSFHEYEELLSSIEAQNGLTRLQIAEAAGVSGAMVLRVALGLSASGAVLSAIVDDCRSGYIALALLRQLANAGSSVSVFTPGIVSEDTPFGQQLFALSQAGGLLFSLEHTPQEEYLEVITNSHAFIFGTFQSEVCTSDCFTSICKELNEQQTPVHCIEFPPGVNPTDGTPGKNPVFAATTLIPGIPIASLANAIDFAGRIYVCDISIPRSQYETRAPALCDLFTYQPVNQIYQNK